MAKAGWALRLLYLCVALCIASNSASKIKHVVVLMEENRSFDHMFGWYPGVNGLTGKEWNPVNTKDPHSKHIYVDKKAPMIAPCDPDHSTTATTYKIFGAASVDKHLYVNASMDGFVEWENKKGHAKSEYCAVMEMMTPQHVPVLSFLASEYALMDRFFASHAGPTWPNRMFMLSATSAGLTETGPWYHDVVGQLFPQETIFDQLNKEGLTWRNYYNDTPWELFLSGLAHNPEHQFPLDQFFVDAREGNLPAFAWINPRNAINVTLGLGSNDQHPDHDVALGEGYYKDVYESLRASPQWNETLFIITYDEHGGFYDHVATPLNVPPPGDGEESYPDKGVLFNRLGVRLPTLLISPWIPKGLVIGAPPASQKPAPNSEYELTSIMSTTRKLLGMKSGPLTKRDAWSATFEQVLSLDTPRTDCPLHTPPAPPPSHNFAPEKEAEMPINDLQSHIIEVHAHLAGLPHPPQHVTKQGHVGEWARRHYTRHSTRTRQWKQSKSAAHYRLSIQPAQYDFVDASWNVKKGTRVPFYTIGLRSLTSYCLDYHTNNSTNTHNIIRQPPTAGSAVGVALCYPSANPDTNRDPAQQWLWQTDATVRPAADQSLCLTTRLLEGDRSIYLEKCTQSSEQRWSYDGPAPGGGNGGTIQFGVWNIGVDN